MTTRKSMEEFLAKCEGVIDFANEQSEEASRQEHYNEEEYTYALQQIEAMHQELIAMHNSANDQQREELRRTKIRLEKIQHEMITRQQSF